MDFTATATAHNISTQVSHVVRTTVVRDDFVGYVVAGHKRLVAPSGEVRFSPGRAFLIPRLTQWDMVNEAPGAGSYEARLIGFSPALVEQFHQRFGQFAATAPVQGSAGTAADEGFVRTFSHAFGALGGSDASMAMRQHRALEVLLLLAERGLVFSMPKALGWAERVRRLVGQRPHAAWSLADVAQAFGQSASTLQRRLSEEGATFSQCLREVRLETAMALLQDRGLQVSEVASRCGYDSHSRFSAAFRARFGYAPSHLRP